MGGEPPQVQEQPAMEQVPEDAQGAPEQIIDQ